MLEWRWDQGRVLYFQFDVLREIAKVLVKFEGKNINDNALNNLFRKALIDGTGLPFAPNNYKVNRNYSRVFQCALLACVRGNSLYVSDICKLLALDNSYLANCDDYLIEVVKRFRFPFPAFQGYDSTMSRVYPFCAIIKLLIAFWLKGDEAKLSLSDICHYIIGNNCHGDEMIDFYLHVRPIETNVDKDTIRQMREMVAFISQLSFLKVFNGYLYLDVDNKEDVDNILENVTKPIQTIPVPDKVEEFFLLTHLPASFITSKPSISHHVSLSIPDLDFAEGKRVRVQHLRIERSPLLRRFYITIHPEPICAACQLHIQHKYPWVDYMLDLHHLLPLSSVVRITTDGTSLNDLVGLCPSCHRAIHSYYRKWLKSNNLEDFRTKQEAMSVYLEAVRGIA
ncbi:MAG: HNH endonuclease [Prevotella sp.]|nr:HNH endonuclease [Prevotella sp.]MBQ6211176.1 HNH endonuclease [Prevotella sp.]